MFTKNKNQETNSPEPTKGAPAQDAIRGAAMKPAARAASIICADMKINGSVISEGALQIDGVVDGDVRPTSPSAHRASLLVKSKRKSSR